jgi:putative flippase GtrA
VTLTGENGQWQQFLAFLITGGIAALVNIGTRIVFNLFMSFEIAVVLAYLCGMTTAYLLARYFVFERSGRAVHDEYIRFTLVNFAAIIQVWIVCQPRGSRFSPFGIFLAPTHDRARHRRRRASIYEFSWP